MEEKNLMLPLVSIIIPVFNVKPFIHECLDSVIQQTYKTIEIIVVDDGSTDGSDEICDIYGNIDSRIRVIHQNNGGLSKARNTGLKNIRGDIVAFLDSDDAYLPNMIETMVCTLIEKKADIVVCGFYNCNSLNRMSVLNTSKVFILDEKSLSSGEAMRHLAEGLFNESIWNRIYIRKVFEGLSFQEGRVYEDILINPFLIKRARKVVTISKPLLLHRCRYDSISNTKTEKNIRDWIFATRNREKFIKSYYSNNQYMKRKGLEHCFWSILMQYLHILNNPSVHSIRIERLFNNEIAKRKAEIQAYSLKTKTVYYLYKLNPHLFQLAARIYRHAINSMHANGK